MIPLNVLLIDSDKEFADYLQRELERESCTVTVCFDGGTGYRQAAEHAFDVVLLGVQLRVLNGFEITKRLRLMRITTPILMLADQTIAEDAVKAFDAGADDYLPKSLGFEFVRAHIRARTRFNVGQVSDHLRFADLFLDAEKHHVVRAGHRLELTRTEFSILKRLMHAAGRVVTRDQIIESVWGDRFISENNLNVFIGFLRAKVDRPGLPRLLHTERGLGYSIREYVV
jgi:DNA-binding response OmpR family regulator